MYKFKFNKSALAMELLLIISKFGSIFLVIREIMHIYIDDNVRARLVQSKVYNIIQFLNNSYLAL